MSNWIATEISDIANSYAGGTPNRSKPEYYNGNIPWISSGEVNQASINNTTEAITEAGLAYSSAKWVPKDSILVAMYGATAGQVSYLNIRATTNQAVLALIPVEGRVDAKFLYYLVNFNRDKILYFAQGSGQPNLNKKIIDTTKVNVPDYLTQQKIAKILSTIDGQIAKTEAIIAKYQAVKQGMLQDLFTRGIDVATGELRPRYEDAPELYKDSPLGMIPKEWDVSKLDNCHTQERYSYTGGPFGSSLKSEDYTNDGVRIIQLQNIGNGIFRDEYKIYTSNNKADELSSCNIFPGEIIIAKMADPLARACIMPNIADRFLMASDGIRLKVDASRFDVKFILETINSHYFRTQALSCSTGTTRARIGLTELRNLKFKHPNLMEQKMAAQRLSSVENEVLIAEKEHNKLQLLKNGLMSDLLSGKVDVTA